MSKQLKKLVDCVSYKRFTGVDCTLTLDVGVGKYCTEYRSKSSGPAKVRCADCISIRYLSGPPESLSCDHHLVVNMRSVTTAERCCALFANRHNQGGCP